MKKRIRTGLFVTGAATASLFAGCGDGDKMKWADAPGTRGLINLDAVKTAFQKNSDSEAFEKRVNEIFEGDQLVIFKADKVDGGFKYTAVEDLNADKKITDADDVLFTLLVANGTATLKGEGANSFYKESWPYDPVKEAKKQGVTDSNISHHRFRSGSFLFWYGLGRAHWGGHYYTQSPQYSAMSQHRNAYRATSAFQSQVKNNAAYENRMASRYGAGFRKGTSTSRNSYISQNRGKMKASGNSGWGVRSRTGVTSSATPKVRSGGSRGFGGFRGSSGFGV